MGQPWRVERGEASERIYRGGELVCEVLPPETVWLQSPPTRDGNKVAFRLGVREPVKGSPGIHHGAKARLLVLSREAGGEWRASWPCMEGVSLWSMAAISEGPVLSILAEVGAEEEKKGIEGASASGPVVLTWRDPEKPCEIRDFSEAAVRLLFPGCPARRRRKSPHRRLPTGGWWRARAPPPYGAAVN